MGHAGRRDRLAQVAALLVIWLFVAGCTVRQMLYPAPAVGVPSPPPAPLEEVSWQLADGSRIVGWAGDAASGPAAPAVLFLHGNGENLETMRRSGLYEELARLGIAWLAVDYPGYGGSEGVPSEEKLVEAAHSGFAELGRRFPGRPRVVCGWSLGAAVAVQVAARNGSDAVGVILLSPWTDLPGLAGEHFPGWLVSLLLRERYDSIRRAAELPPGALVIHGRRDSIIPVEHGRALAGELRRARYLEVADAGHNDLLARAEVWVEIADYLKSL